MIPAGHTSVMSQRTEALDSLDFFPTPPFATRALCEHVLFKPFSSLPGFFTYREHLGSPKLPFQVSKLTAWEPAAGEGHMAEPLKEYFGKVYATDVHDYGKGYTVGSFVGEGADRAEWVGQPADWIITNPPFRLAQEFAERAIEEARVGVALLLRSVFIESAARFKLFEKYPLTVVAPFAERVAMTKDKWDPKASTATSYTWFVWCKMDVPRWPRLVIIPPGRKAELTKPDDAERFGWKPADTHLEIAVASLGGE